MSNVESNDMLRLVYVIDNLSFRGGERTFLQLIERLDRARFDISVACTPGGRFVERLEELRVPVIPVDMRRRRLDTVLKLARIFRRRRPHIVHTQGRGDPFGRLAARLGGVPAIVSTTAAIGSRYHVDELWRKALYRLIDLTTDRLVDRWIVVNHSSVDVLRERHGIPTSRIVVIPNGIELDRYDRTHTDPGIWRRRLGVPDGAFLVGSLGRLTEHKGFPELVRAFASLADADIWLAIGGAGPLQEELETMAQGTGGAERCCFPGFIDDVPGFLAGLDAFVLASHMEGHPMVLLEAMAMRIPVIATAIPGITDTVADGVDGRLVPPGDPEAIAAAIRELRDDPDTARRLGRNARQKIERDYTVERMVARTRLVYDELVSDG